MLSLQLVEFAGVHRSEAFPNAIDQDAQHHHRDHHVEENPHFDHQRHAVSRQRDGREHHAVFHRQQRQHLGDGFAPVDHEKKPGEQQRDGHGQRVAAQPFERGDGAGDDIGQDGQRAADEHGGGHVDERADFLFDLDLAHQPFQEPRAERKLCR